MPHNSTCHHTRPRVQGRTGKKAKETIKEKYGVDNPQKNVDINKKSLETKKQKYNERYLLETSYDRMFKKYQDLGYTLLVEKENYQGTNQKNVVRYQFRHESCGHIFETYIYSSHLPVCPVCYYKSPSFVSKAEKEIGDWIKEGRITDVKTIISFYWLLATDEKNS